MKATMSQDGVITLEPETGVEAYALRKWSGTNSIVLMPKDLMWNEDTYWRGSGLIVHIPKIDDGGNKP